MDEAHEAVHAFEPSKQFLGIGCAHFGDISNDQRLELMPLDACGGEHPHLTFVQLIKAALDDAAHRLGEVAADRINAPRQAPLPGGLGENALFSKVFQEVGHEERVPLCASMNKLDELRVQVSLWQLQRQVVRDVVPAQELERDFPEPIPSLQSLADDGEWMSRPNDLLPTIGDHEERSERVELP